MGGLEDPEKTPLSRVESKHKLNPVMALSPVIEPGPHWGEASARALSTALSLLP